MFKIHLLIPLIFFGALVWNRSIDGQEQFDYFTLVFQWPRTFYKSHNLPNVPRNIWTIHGFWPSNDNGNHPRSCQNTAFNYLMINQNVRNRMENMWPNLKKGTNQQFWTTQWQNHGTCSNMSIGNYFRKAIELSDQYNIMEILLNRNITPSMVYDIREIEAAMRNRTGKWAAIAYKYVHEKYAWLYEIRFCFDRQFNLENCKLYQITDVYYPTSGQQLPPQHLMLNGQNLIRFSFSGVILSVLLSNLLFKVFNEFY